MKLKKSKSFKVLRSALKKRDSGFFTIGTEPETCEFFLRKVIDRALLDCFSSNEEDRFDAYCWFDEDNDDFLEFCQIARINPDYVLGRFYSVMRKFNLKENDVLLGTFL